MVGGSPIPIQRGVAQAYIPPRLESTGAVAPKLLARGQSDDAPQAVRIPTPDELGLGMTKPVAGTVTVDWSMVERRLDAIGATGYKIEKAESGFRFTFDLPSGPVSGRGATKGEAVRNTLAQLPR